MSRSSDSHLSRSVFSASSRSARSEPAKCSFFPRRVDHLTIFALPTIDHFLLLEALEGSPSLRPLICQVCLQQFLGSPTCVCSVDVCRPVIALFHQLTKISPSGLEGLPSFPRCLADPIENLFATSSERRQLSGRPPKPHQSLDVWFRPPYEATTQAHFLCGFVHCGATSPPLPASKGRPEPQTTVCYVTIPVSFTSFLIYLFFYFYFKIRRIILLDDLFMIHLKSIVSPKSFNIIYYMCYSPKLIYSSYPLNT